MESRRPLIKTPALGPAAGPELGEPFGNRLKEELVAVSPGWAAFDQQDTCLSPKVSRNPCKQDALRPRDPEAFMDPRWPHPAPRGPGEDQACCSLKRWPTCTQARARTRTVPLPVLGPGPFTSQVWTQVSPSIQRGAELQGVTGPRPERGPVPETPAQAP